MDIKEQGIERETGQAAPREWQRPSLRRLSAESAEFNVTPLVDGKKLS